MENLGTTLLEPLESGVSSVGDETVKVPAVAGFDIGGTLPQDLLAKPGPQDGPVQCFIKRDKITATYHLFLGIPPNVLEMKNPKLLLAAQEFRHASFTEYIISSSTDDMSSNSSTYVGKLRANFLGTKFNIKASLPVNGGEIPSTNGAGRRRSSSKVSPGAAEGDYSVARVTHKLNILGRRGPRRIECSLHTVPASAMQPRQCAARYEPSSDEVDTLLSRGGPLLLRNRPPRWHDQLKCWCLNFRGRVTMASVKSFQLVAATEDPSQKLEQAHNHEKVLLQFGKIGPDVFTMDYRYPLSAFEAFAMSLTCYYKPFLSISCTS